MKKETLTPEQIESLQQKCVYAKLRKDLNPNWTEGKTYIVLAGQGPLFWTSSDSREEAFAKLVELLERWRSNDKKIHTSCL